MEEMTASCVECHQTGYHRGNRGKNRHQNVEGFVETWKVLLIVCSQLKPEFTEGNNCPT